MNMILGQSHFIKSVEDLYELMANAGGGIKFGIAFLKQADLFGVQQATTTSWLNLQRTTPWPLEPPRFHHFYGGRIPDKRAK